MKLSCRSSKASCSSQRFIKARSPSSSSFEVLKKYTTHYELDSVKTLTLGSLFRLDYDITLKDPAKMKKMIDELRVRNSNLEIVCARPSTNRDEL